MTMEFGINVHKSYLFQWSVLATCKSKMATFFSKMATICTNNIIADDQNYSSLSGMTVKFGTDTDKSPLKSQ